MAPDWLVFGPVYGTNAIDSAAGAVFYGDGSGWGVGLHNAWTPDANGDGVDEWVIGASNGGPDTTGAVAIVPVGL